MIELENAIKHLDRYKDTEEVDSLALAEEAIQKAIDQAAAVKPGKLTVWTLASDDDNGTTAQVFATEHEAYTAQYEAAFGSKFSDEPDESEPATQKAKAALEAAAETGDYEAFQDAVSDWLEGSMDTYSIDYHQIETTQVEPEPTTNEEMWDKLIELQTAFWELGGRLEAALGGEIDLTADLADHGSLEDFLAMRDDDEEDEEGRNKFLNHYNCKHVDRLEEGQEEAEWEDESESMNNDKCPVCNAEIEPYESEDLNEDDDESEGDEGA